MRRVALFSRRPARPGLLPVTLPRLDGSGWPDQAEVGRPTFQASTYYELGMRNAFEIEAHAVADRLIEDLLPRVPTGVDAQDEPYLRKVFTTAARVGAGIGMVERGLGPVDPALVDRHVAGALWQARRKLPAMQPDWALAAGWFLLAGFHLSRRGLDALPGLAAQLDPPVA